jgi:hypothetical protein
MSSKRTLAVAILTLAITGAGSTPLAQETCLEHVLVPIRANQVPGAHGSLWHSSLTITNHSETTVTVAGIDSCGLGLCMDPSLPPDATATPRFYHEYITMACEDVAKLDISLRVRDLSRALDTWGTSIPVVYERDVHRGGVISITDIPNSPEFRSLLRIYAVERGTREQVHVTFFAVPQNREPEDAVSDEPLMEFEVMLEPQPLRPFTTPGLAEIPLQTIPELQDADVVRVEIVGRDGVGFWAMVSATNNHTQHVTMLLPPPPPQPVPQEPQQ